MGMINLSKKVMVGIASTMLLIQMTQGREIHATNLERLDLLKNGNWLEKVGSTRFRVINREEEKPVVANVTKIEVGEASKEKKDSIRSIKDRMLDLLGRNNEKEEGKESEEIEQINEVDLVYKASKKAEALEQESFTEKHEATILKHEATILKDEATILKDEAEESPKKSTLTQDEAVAQETSKTAQKKEEQKTSVETVESLRYNSEKETGATVNISKEQEKPAVSEKEQMYFWFETNESGEVVSRLISKEEYVRLCLNIRVNAQETAEAMKFIYTISNWRSKLFEGSILVVVGSILYRIGNIILERFDTGLEAMVIGKVPVIPLILPALAIIAGLSTKYQKKKGSILSIVALLSVYQIKHILFNNEESLKDVILLNWPNIASLAVVLFLFMYEYGAMTIRNKTFPSLRIESSIRMVSIVAIATIAMLLISAAYLSEVVPSDSPLSAYLESTLYMVSERSMQNIVYGCCAILSFCASIITLNIRPLVVLDGPKEKRNLALIRIGSILVALVLGSLFAQIVQSPPMDVLVTKFVMLGLIFAGSSILFEVGTSVLPADSLIKRHKNIISMIILLIAVKLTISVGAYVIIRSMGKEEAVLAFLKSIQDKIYGICGSEGSSTGILSTIYSWIYYVYEAAISGVKAVLSVSSKGVEAVKDISISAVEEVKSGFISIIEAITSDIGNNA